MAALNEGQLTRALAAGNAWWRDPRWERDDRDLRPLAARTLDYEPSPLSDVAPDGLYVLRGPRRVGKSVEVKRAISRLIRGGVQPRSIIHFACDELGRGDLQRLVNAGREVLTRGLEGARYWFLDEITSVPAWPEAIKWLRDNTAFGEDCVVLTGSSARDLTDAQKQLAGRLGSAGQSDRLLLPMGFRRFARSMGVVAPPRPDPVRTRDDQSAGRRVPATRHGRRQPSHREGATGRPGVRLPGMALPQARRQRAEQQLGIELLRCMEREQPGTYAHFSDVMYQRTSGKEVDFCGPRMGKLGFEGKYVDSGWKREALTVRSAFGAGVLATRGLLDTSGEVWAVPAPFVAWMLGD